jgi:hypothetical protein
VVFSPDPTRELGEWRKWAALQFGRQVEHRPHGPIGQGLYIAAAVPGQAQDEVGERGAGGLYGRGLAADVRRDLSPGVVKGRRDDCERNARLGQKMTVSAGVRVFTDGDKCLKSYIFYIEHPP